MKIQHSFKSTQEKEAGCLFLVGTPIGNLDDMTMRAIRTLKEVEWIAAEDTRQTRKLLSHYDIHTQLTSYHAHNRQTSGASLIDKMLQGQSVALVSDAGLPAISDPGFELVKEAIEHDIRVIPIPGANAALSALIVSGLDTSRFTFVGFLPKDKKKRSAVLEQLEKKEETLILYESPHHIIKTLQDMFEVWGERRIVLARELTKKFEEISRGTISQAIDLLQIHGPRGEYSIVVAGRQEVTASEHQQILWWSLLSLEEHIDYYIDKGIERKEALKKVAVDRHVTRRDVYNKLIESK